MKKFAGNMIFCGAAFVLLVALTATNAQAQNHNIRKPEPVKPNLAQVPNPWNVPQKNMQQLPQQTPYQPQQRPIVVPAAAVIPVANHHKPTPVVVPNHNHHVVNTPSVKYEPPRYVQPVMPAHHITVAPAHVCPEPQNTVIVVQPKKTLLDKLFDKIF